VSRICKQILFSCWMWVLSAGVVLILGSIFTELIFVHRCLADKKWTTGLRISWYMYFCAWSTECGPLKDSSHTHLSDLTRLLAGRHAVMVWTSFKCSSGMIFLKFLSAIALFPSRHLASCRSQNRILDFCEFAKCLSSMEKKLIFLMHVDAQCRCGINDVLIFTELIFVCYCLW